MEYWVKCPLCGQSYILGGGNYEFIDRVGYENCIKIILPTVCRSCKKSIIIDELEVRSKNPRNIFEKT